MAIDINICTFYMGKVKYWKMSRKRFIIYANFAISSPILIQFFLLIRCFQNCTKNGTIVYTPIKNTVDIIIAQFCHFRAINKQV